MFIGRKESFEKEVLKIVKDNFDGDRVCEVCGCLIKTTEAVKGVSVIKKMTKGWEYTETVDDFLKKDLFIEYVYTPYYCKVHAPRNTEAIEKQVKEAKMNIPKIKTKGEGINPRLINLPDVEIRDYSGDFKSCNSLCMEPWERLECHFCIHYDASEYEKWKEEKIKGLEYVDPYVVSCRHIDKLLKEEYSEKH